MAREDLPWLIKSSGRIIGPFPGSKIIELLRSREVSVLDEVSAPLRRWQTIQYHGDFKEVVESLRRANISDKTEATWTPTGVTSNLTQTVTDLNDSELTEEVTNDIDFSQTSKEIVVHNVQDLGTTGTAQTPAGRFQAQQGQNTAIQRQVEKTTRGLWVVTIIILCAVAAFIVQKRLVRPGGEAKPSLAALRQAVLSDVNVGYYTEALRELRNFFPDPTQSGEMAIYYGSLLVQVEGQTVIGRRLLNSVITNHRPEIKQAYTSLGVADLIENQLDAAKDNFDKALAVDPTYVPAVVNSAIVALMRGDYILAKSLALKALQLKPTAGEALLALTEAQYYLFIAGGNMNELNQVNKRVKEFRQKQWDFASELGFYSLYFDFLKHDDDLDDHLREYLDQDPQLTADHRHSVFIYKGHTQWKVLGRLCEKMTEKMGDGAWVSALAASCASHELRWDQARRAIEKSVQQAPKDSLTQAWFSYILRESNDATQANVVLGRASEFNRRGTFTLPVLLQARFCASTEDFDCARDSWQRIYEKNTLSLPAISGLAWVSTHKGFKGEALKLLDIGLKISPDYIPLLQLRLKAEREGWYATN